MEESDRATATTNGPPATEQQVVGTWRLNVFERRMKNWNVTFPLGPDAIGYLTYTPDGYVFVSIMRAERLGLATHSWHEWTPEERSAAAADFVAYCGRYEILGGQMVHHVEQSLFPNWIGTTQKRFAELEGDRLTLATEPFDSGQIPISLAVWERASGARAGGQRSVGGLQRRSRSSTPTTKAHMF